MFDPEYYNFLIKFKDKTNEDLIIASLIRERIELKIIDTVLDIGAGTGNIPLVLEKMKGIPFEKATLVESQSELTQYYPAHVETLNQDFFETSIDHTYDLVILSQVIGDIPQEKRGDFITKALNHMKDDGVLISVENGSNETFDSFVKNILKEQPMPYTVDFTDFENQLNSEQCIFKKDDVEMVLKISNTPEKFIENCNVLFPNILNSKNISKQLINTFRLNTRTYGLPITQRVYTVQKKINNKAVLACK